ncbi:MAG: response regulator [Rubrivivax sp.]|nr:response regulator [Rubrivivax sp.]
MKKSRPPNPPLPAAAEALAAAGAGRWRWSGAGRWRLDAAARRLLGLPGGRGSAAGPWPMDLVAGLAVQLARAGPVAQQWPGPGGPVQLIGRSDGHAAAGLLLPCPGDARAADRGANWVAGIGHELRTPLNAIMGFTRLAQAESPPPTLQRRLAHIAEASGSMLHVVDDLLDLARLEAGRLEMRPDQPLDLPELVRRVAALATALRPSPAVALYATVEAACPRHLRGDGGRLAQVLVNLTANALKFTDRGRVVLSVRLRRREARQVELRFGVADTGVGIAAQNLDGLGQAYERAGARAPGTGLGLALVRRLLALAGSQLHLASVAGGGTLAWFDLVMPLDDRAEAPDPAPDTAVFSTDRRLLDSVATQWRARGLGLLPPSAWPQARRVVIDMAHPDAEATRWAARARGQVVLCTSATAVPEGIDDPEGPFALALLCDWALDGPAPGQREWPRQLDGLHLLVLDDNLLNQRVLQDELQRMGAVVTVAGDGAAAARAVADSAIDALILDLHLGREHGLDVARMLRSQPQGRRLPLVVLSAHVEPADAQAAQALGALACLGKPHDPQHLADLLAPLPRRDGARASGRPGQAPASPAAATDLNALFASHWPSLRAPLEAAAAAGDAAALLDAVHALRGSLAFLGDRSAVARARALDAALRQAATAPLSAAHRQAVAGLLADGDRLARG